MSLNDLSKTLDDVGKNFTISNNANVSAGPLSLGETVIRKYLIYSAVNFINNPRILGTPKDQKTVFLLKKGLTQDEIDLAFDLCITRPSNDALLKRELDLLSSLSLGQLLISSNNALSRLINFVYSLVVLGGFAYGAYHLYQTKIRYYLDQTLQEEGESNDPYQKIQNQVTAIKDEIAQLNKNLITIDNFLQTYCSFSQDSLAAIIKEIKSTKSLLVNKNQFPLVPSIPKWQYKNGDTNSKDTNGESEISCNGSSNTTNLSDNQ